VSRIGRKPVEIPKGVAITLREQAIAVKGPKGELTWNIPAEITVKSENQQIVVSRPSDDRSHKALHGLTRKYIANMIEGVTQGFVRKLEIEGVGYSAELKGKALMINIGFSHPVLVTPPPGITFEVPKALNISVLGTDKQLVGQVAAKIRSIRPPEPYKAKGIRYQGEYIRRKAGKKVGVK